MSSNQPAASGPRRTGCGRIPQAAASQIQVRCVGGVVGWSVVVVGGGGDGGGWVGGGDEDWRANARRNDVTELRVFHASNRI